jgi:quercetin dioxygenase-like cupin family protein
MRTIPTDTEALWFGESLVEIRVSAGDGDGELSLVETTTPYRAMPPLLVHDEDQTFYVLDGEATFFVGDEEIAAAAGDAVVAPRGRPYTFRPESDEARMLMVTNGSFERFLRSVSRPAAKRATPGGDRWPTLEEAAAVGRAATRHGIEILGPPGMLPTEL